MPSLVIERGEDRGREYPILERAFIGRHRQADIALLDLSVSRRHCLVVREGGRYYIEDLGSRNGTVVNGKLITSRTWIRGNDLIRLGATWLRFQAGGEEELDLERIFPQYQILEPLGRGGMGYIFKAIHVPLERTVALKVLPPQLVRENPGLRSLFLQEASSIAKLHHENVCMMLDFGVREPVIYFTMEYIAGSTLEQYISLYGNLEILEALRLSLQIAKGLQHAHNQGLLHCDIKPRNIMLDQDKNAKIIDFGLAKVMAGLDPEGFTSVAAMGTLEYISPEQAQNLPLDERSDIYSLGVTMYEMLAGRTPFEGDTPYTLIRKHLEVKPPPVHKLNASVPPEVCELLDFCLAKNREERCPSCHQLIRQLERCIELYEEKEVIYIQESRLDRVLLRGFMLLGESWFCWLFFPGVAVVLAVLLQFLF